MKLDITDQWQVQSTECFLLKYLGVALIHVLIVIHHGKLNYTKKKQIPNFLRRKSFDKIREELLYYKKLKAEYLYFWSDTFFSWKKNEFYEFCEIYEDIKLPFWIQTRPETVRYEQFKRLKDIGCHRISFGIEHGNEKFRAEVLGRYFKNRGIIEKLKIVNKVGIPFSVNNIIGFPGESRELVFDTIELNRKIKADDRSAYPFTPFSWNTT